MTAKKSRESNNGKVVNIGNSGTVVAGGEVVGNWVGWEVTEGVAVDVGAAVGATVGARVGKIVGVAVGVAPNAITTVWLL